VRCLINFNRVLFPFLITFFDIIILFVGYDIRIPFCFPPSRFLFKKKKPFKIRVFHLFTFRNSFSPPISCCFFNLYLLYFPFFFNFPASLSLVPTHILPQPFYTFRTHISIFSPVPLHSPLKPPFLLPLLSPVPAKHNNVHIYNAKLTVLQLQLRGLYRTFS